MSCPVKVEFMNKDGDIVHETYGNYGFTSDTIEIMTKNAMDMVMMGWVHENGEEPFPQWSICRVDRHTYTVKELDDMLKEAKRQWDERSKKKETDNIIVEAPEPIDPLENQDEIDYLTRRTKEIVLEEGITDAADIARVIQEIVEGKRK